MELPAGLAVQAATTLGITALFPLLRWLLHVALFKPIALRCLRHVWRQRQWQDQQQHQQQQRQKQKLQHPLLADSDGGGGCGGGGDEAATRGRNHREAAAVEKFCESLWKLAVYACFVGLAVAALWRQPWALDSWQFWRGWPRHELTPAMAALYNLQLGFYLASVAMILTWEVRRRDFCAMFGHHVATAALIGASMWLRFWRVGVVTMLLHDACDVLMEAAKLCKYARREAASLALFAGFFAAWVTLRLGLFPLHVLRSTLLELPAALGTAATPPLYYGFNALLLALLLLHVYWFGLILRVVALTLATGRADDVREDDGDEDGI